MSLARKIADAIMKPKIKKLFSNDFISICEIIAPAKGINGYSYLHESRCNGKIISILPYRKINDKIQYLLRKEITPCWGLNPLFSSITGGDEGNIPQSAIRELKEEAGYTIDETELIDLGTCFGTKSTDTIYYLFSCDLTKKTKEIASGDGSYLEKIATVKWVLFDTILIVKDPLVSTICLRLKSKE